MKPTEHFEAAVDLVPVKPKPIQFEEQLFWSRKTEQDLILNSFG